MTTSSDADVPTAAAGARVVIIGGSISGLATGLALAQHGVEVEILERDAPIDIDAPGSMEEWWRRGSPQSRHSHACLGLARQVLLSRAPKVWTALLKAGAREIPSGGRLSPNGEWLPASDDAQLVGLACRRPLLEAVLRRCVRDQPGVRFRPDTEVTGFRATGPGIPTVTGVTTTTGELAADLVIDASGRASALLSWLRQVGARRPQETAESCNVLYLSRFYRLRRYPDAVINRAAASGGIFRSSICVAIPGDHDTVQVTLGVPAGDPALRALGNGPAFTAAAALHPFVAPWLQHGAVEPISDVAPMARMQNRLRRFVVNDQPTALGLLPVGDAACITNPAFGRGMSLAFRHAFAIGDLVATGIDDPHQLALVADQLTPRLLEPWYKDAVEHDRARVALWAGVPPPTENRSDTITMGHVMAAAPHDPLVWRAATRRFNLLDEPDALFADDAVIDAVRNGIAAGTTPAPSGPSREELLACLDDRLHDPSIELRTRATVRHQRVTPSMSFGESLETRRPT